VTPFHKAREAAWACRYRSLQGRANEPLSSKEAVAAALRSLDIDLQTTKPDDPDLCGADSLLDRTLRQILVRDNATSDERYVLISHEIGHHQLHTDGVRGCHSVVASELNPLQGETIAARRVEAYGARERAEIQANIFAREFLLPLGVARAMFMAGTTADAIAAALQLPIELVRLQLIDALLLPVGQTKAPSPKKGLKPTTSQKKAAESTAKVSLVVAGPGTGKTAALMFRIKHLLDQGAKPHEILALTFSNRAAREIQERLAAMDVPHVDSMWVGTFHAFGLELLRKHHEEFGLKPTFRVIDRLSQVGILESNLHLVELEHYNQLGDTVHWLKDVVDVIARLKEELVTPSEYLKAVSEEVEVDEVLKAQRRDVAKIYALYERLKATTGSLVDLMDLVVLPVRALETNAGALPGTAGVYKHILVDEYQDVNRANARLVRALAKSADNLWVVGDPRQAIYRFRGASLRNVVKFGDDYPKHKTFDLLENRRSTTEIVKLFEHTGRDHPLQMSLPLGDFESIAGESGQKPIMVVCPSDGTMYDRLVMATKEQAAAGIPYSDQAVLAYSHDLCGKGAAALNAAGVPALYLGDIFERPEVKDLLSVLQSYIDPSGSALLRVGQLTRYSVAPDALDKLIAALKATRTMPLGWGQHLNLISDRRSRQALERLLGDLNAWNPGTSPWEVLCGLCLGEARLIDPYVKGNDILSATRRLAVWQFLHFLRTPDGLSGYQDIGTFLRNLKRRLRLNDDRELRIPPPEANVLDAVIVTTIHQSKGLEFDTVHLVDVDAYNFKEAEGQTALIPLGLLGVLDRQQDSLEAKTEGANRLYVALSRARKHLFLYQNEGRGGAELAAPLANASHLCELITVRAKDDEEAELFSQPVRRRSDSIISQEDFARYIRCPRSYYYDNVLQLSPLGGTPDFVRIETAAFKDLFVSSESEASTSRNNLKIALGALKEAEVPRYELLERYADQLMRNGRDLIEAEYAILPKTLVIDFEGLNIAVQPHMIHRGTNQTRIVFVRARPLEPKAAAMQVLRWAAREAPKRVRGTSLRFEVADLATRSIEPITPYTERASHVGEIAARLLNLKFEARMRAPICHRCKHYFYCPI